MLMIPKSYRSKNITTYALDEGAHRVGLYFDSKTHRFILIYLASAKVEGKDETNLGIFPSYCVEKGVCS